MSSSRRTFSLFSRGGILPLVLCLWVLPTAQAEDSFQLDPQQIRWHRLDFTAAKLFAQGTAKIQLAEELRSRAEKQFLEAPGHRAIEATSPHLIRLELESVFGGRESSISLWLDPTNARALERLKLRRGSKAYQKTWRFTKTGLFSHRRAPRQRNEAQRPPEAWGNIEEEFRPHHGDSDCSLITTPSALFYLASATELKTGDTLIFCAVSGKSLSRVEVHAQDRKDLRVEYTRNSSSGSHPVQENIETLRLVVKATPLDPREDKGNFEFLGLKSHIELFVDLADRLPVEVRGRLPVLGGVEVKLAAATLR